MSAPKHTPGPWTSYPDRTVGASGLPLLRCYAGRNEEANARLISAAPDLLSILSALVDEFGCTIEQYHKIGPDWTMKDGTETFNVSVVLDREELIEKARAAIAMAAQP